MIEAVNATLSSSPALRATVEQVDVARFAANPGRVQEAAPLPQAPYVSPYIFVDVNFDKAVLQIRDGETGDVVRQFPSESALKIRAYHAQAESAAQFLADSAGSDASSTESAGGSSGGVAPAPAPAPVPAPVQAQAPAQQASAPITTVSITA